MAKLENVKVLDMVNGEVTKVEYNKELYVKRNGFDEGADAGNLLLCTYASGRHFLQNEFYEVIRIGKRPIIDEDGYAPYIGDSKFVVFRKVSDQEQPPSLEQRVSALESDVSDLKGETQYRKVNRSHKVGDYVKYNEQDDDYITVGTYYKVIDLDDVNPVFIDDTGEENYAIYSEDWDLYEKVTSEQPKEDEQERLKVGDYAKVVGDDLFEIGDIVKVVDVDENDFGHMPYRAVRESDGEGYWVTEQDLVKVSEEEVAKAEEAKKWATIGRAPNEFKEGDIVRYKKAITTVLNVRGINVEINQSTHVSSTYVTNKDSDDIALITPVEQRFDKAEGLNA